MSVSEFCFALVLALARPAAGSGADQERPGRISDSILQIGIVPKASRLALRPEGRFSAVDQQTGEARPLEARREYEVRTLRSGGLAFGTLSFHGPIRLLPGSAGGLLGVGGKKYRGSFLVRSNADGTLSLISEMGLEEYLYGVLPAEMNSDWPLDALKAQAVVARTFALVNLDKFRSSGFDLSGDSRSQAYADVGQQNADVVRAVQDTQGEVLTWRGELLPVYFHSCCGGRTASAKSVWGGKAGLPRPLAGVSDRWCRPSPEYRWTAYFPAEDIVAALQRHGFSFARLRNIRPGRRDRSDFLETIRVNADGDTSDVRAASFRDWVGNSEIKSTKIIRIAKRGRGFEFMGRGYGHGVGLCQWGAYYMAKNSRGYRKILAYYFPGAKISKHDE